MIRDYIYIRDVVAGYLCLAEAMDRPELWVRANTLSMEAPLSVLEITEKILAVMGWSDLRPVILNEVKAEIFEQHLSAARARQELNWRPRHSPESSLAETIAWYRNYLGQDAPRPSLS